MGPGRLAITENLREIIQRTSADFCLISANNLLVQRRISIESLPVLKTIESLVAMRNITVKPCPISQSKYQPSLSH